MDKKNGKIKLALLGCWHVHTFMYLPLLQKEQKDLVEFTVVWEENAGRGQDAAERLGAPFEPDLEKALTDYESCGVIVQCATTSHKKVLLRAAACKKHIFCEKVLAPTVEECLEIQKAVLQNGVKFMISLDALPYGVYRLARDLIRKGSLGQIGSAYVRRVHGMAYGEEGGLPDYWYDSRQTAGGATIDLGTHGISLLSFLFGRAKDVTALTQSRLGHGQDDVSTIAIRFENGVLAASHTSFFAAHLENYVEIIGNQGRLAILGFIGLNQDKTRVFLQSDLLPGFEEDKEIPPEMLPATQPLTIQQFLQLLQSEEQEIPDYGMEEAIQLTRLVESAYLSAALGRTIRLSEVFPDPVSPAPSGPASDESGRGRMYDGLPRKRPGHRLYPGIKPQLPRKLRDRGDTF